MPRPRPKNKLLGHQKLAARDLMRAEAVSLYLQQKSIPQIARELELSTGTVHVYIRDARAMWLNSALVDIGQRIADELARIDHLEQVYWDAWEKSKTDKVRVTRTLVDPKLIVESKGEDFDVYKDGKVETKRYEELTSSPGDFHFLQGIEWCLERRALLLGLDAPERKDTLGMTALGVVEEIVSVATYRELPEATITELPKGV